MSWPTVPIGSVCRVIAGQSPPGNAYNDQGEGLPFYQGKKEFAERYLEAPTVWTTHVTKRATAGDILMSVRAPVGPINEAREEICIGRGLAAIRNGGDINRDYLWYALSWLQPEIAGNDGAVFPSINKSQIEALEIPLPPMQEQERIVAKLDQAFASLDHARANADANLTAATDLTGSAVAAMFDQVAHSETMPLAAVSDFEGGSQPPKSEFVYEPREGYIRLLQIRDFTSDEKAVYIADDGRRRRCKSNDIMIGRYGASVGQIHTGKEGCYNVALIKSIPNEKLVERDYFYYYLKSDLFQKPLLARSSRGAQDGFSKSDIADFRVPLPNLSDQKTAVSRVRIIESHAAELRDRYENILGSVGELRQSLLHAAFSGQLT